MSNEIDYRQYVHCPMCGAETGQACKVISNYDGTYKPGDTRPEPHFYRETTAQRDRATKDRAAK